MTAFDHHRTARYIMLATILIAATALVARAKGPEIGATDPRPDRAIDQHLTQQPRIDVVFALDTTGSMAGLIEGAKQKIWSVASALADGVPTPIIRIGLVAYRDRGDSYVTRVHDLTDDLDRVYEQLQGFAAGGGGDTPESVNQALHDAVNRMSWSAGSGVYKVVFLVGDAPPHLDYPNDVRYDASVRLAKSRGITINTIQCGAQPGTGDIWREIAMIGGGRFAAIQQDGAMVAMETPMDADLARLNSELAETVIAWGDADDRAEIERKVAASKASPDFVAASRLAYLSKSGKRANSGRRDLVDAVRAGVAEVGDLPSESLPPEMRVMDAADRLAYVEQRRSERDAIQVRIDELTRSRDEHLRVETEKLAASGDNDGFDQQVLETIREQSAGAGIHYE